MQSYFYISNIQIPIELKPLYLKISNEFESKVYDSNKTEQENESTEKSCNESNHEWQIHYSCKWRTTNQPRGEVPWKSIIHGSKSNFWIYVGL